MEENGCKGFTLKELINKIKKLRQRYRKKRKSNVEKSLEVIFAKFEQSSAAEFERY